MKRFAKHVWVGAVLCTIGTGVAQAQQRRGLPAPEEVILPENGAQFPMLRYELLPTIEVMINGEGPFRLVVDTGASGVVLDADSAERLDLPAPPGVGGAQIQVMSPAGPIEASLGFIEELSIGDVEMRGVWTLSTKLPFGDYVNGVIGVDLFRTGLITYDYPANQFVISRGELPESNGRDVFTYETPGESGSYPTIEMIVGDQPTEFLLDTGYRGWFTVPNDFADSHDVHSGPAEGPMALSAGGPVETRVARSSDPFSIGQYNIQFPIVMMPSVGSSSRLLDRYMAGTSFLENFAITFDGTNKRIQFADGPDTPIKAAALRYSGLGLKPVGDQLEVWAVRSDSHAQSIGIETGDRILKINGKPAAEYYRSVECQRLLTSAASVEVTYAPKGTEAARTDQVRLVEILPGA